MIKSAGIIPVRRRNYATPIGEQEFFVTPLIRKSIEDGLAAVGSPAKGAKVLDIGAGECPLRSSLEAIGFFYQSLDIQQNSQGSIDYIARIDQKLPEALLSSCGFDLLLITEVLEHVPDWEAAFANISALLKPGGKCIITVPFFYMLHEEPFDYWRPTVHALRYFATSKGLDVIDARRNGDGWEVLGTLLCSTSVYRRRKGVTAYLAVAPIWLAHKLLKWFFMSRVLQPVVELQMRYYTGNYFLLSKKCV